jgi:penicillin-binding protein 1A
MKVYIQKVLKEVKRQLISGYQKSKPFLQRLQGKLQRVIDYFERNKTTRRWVTVLSIPLYFLSVLLLVVLISTPGKRELIKIQNPLASEVYTADSVLLGRYFLQDRTYVKYDDISPVVINALISTEDVRFYEHSGIDFVSLGRVLFKSILLQDESSGGGSTLTQQLAKNLYPRKKYWVLSMVMNKLREVIIALRIENIYSKEDIIALYLNTIPFADNTYGIQAASQRFYSTEAKGLTLNQAAVLIGMLKATHYYNPRLFPKRALQRRNVVMRQMVKYNFISSATADAALKIPLKLKYRRALHNQELAPYFREYLKTEIQKWCDKNTKPDGSEYNLYVDGLKIYTTIDSKLQEYAERAVTRQMTLLQKQFIDHWGKEKPWKDKESLIEDAIQRSPRYRALKEQRLSEKAIRKELNKPVLTRLFTWEGEEERYISPIDSIKHHMQFLNAGFVAVEPSTGYVKAWVGGINHDFFQYDHVKISTKRQVGSIFKPIVYATAIEQGISPCEWISAGQQTYIDDEGQQWTPRNMQYDYQVNYSMRGALAYSVNTVSVKLIQRAGIENTIRLARKMGMTSEIPDVPSIALGSSAISLLEMTAAYTCLANEGVASFPTFITAIRDTEGNTFTNFKSEVSGKQALSKETAQMVRHMLQGVVLEGTASRLRWKYGIENDVAGKTGTTQANADGWFMGMTPKLVVGAWVGADDPRIRFRTTHLGQGSNTALPIAGYFLQHVNQDPAYREISQARFPRLSQALQQKLNCDLYDLNENLWKQIEATIHERDSIMMADTLAKPAETFLQTLYKRKLKIRLASQPVEADKLQSENTTINFP